MEEPSGYTLQETMEVLLRLKPEFDPLNIFSASRLSFITLPLETFAIQTYRFILISRYRDQVGVKITSCALSEGKKRKVKSVIYPSF